MQRRSSGVESSWAGQQGTNRVTAVYRKGHNSVTLRTLLTLLTLLTLPTLRTRTCYVQHAICNMCMHMHMCMHM